jgi:L-iditol 2-dehydrogenase
MLEPLNTVLRAVNKLELKRGQTVVVFGQGAIGLMFTQLCKQRGARVIGADLLEARLRAAKKFGASAAINAAAADFKQQVLALTNNCGADAAVVAVPSARAIEAAISSTCAGGKVLLFAHTRRGDLVPMDAGAICVDERHVMGSYSSSPHLMKECARLIFQRRINIRDLVTHRFPIEEIDTAIRLASNPTENSLKIIITPQSQCSVKSQC